MPNPLYEMLNPGMAPQASFGGFANPMQKMAFLMRAMTNPAEFVRQQFPDIPANIRNDPMQILGYLQQTRGYSDQQVQQARDMAGQIIGQGSVR